MKNIGRLALLGLFAAVGVGLAVCVGDSAQLSDQKHPSKPVELAAVLKVEAQPANLDVRVQSPVAESISPDSTGVANSASTCPVAVDPHPQYGQESVPPGDASLPKMLDVLRKGLTGPRTTPPPPTALVPPPSTSPTPPAPKTSIDSEGDGKLRIQIHDEDLRTVLNFLSEQGGLNILASKNVEGKVSATLNGVDIETALRAILRSTGFVFRRDGNFIFVGTPEDFNSMEQGLDRVGTRVYRTNYVTAAELKALVTPLLTEKIGIVSVSSQAEAGIATNDSVAGGDKFSGGEVLVARDYEAVLSQIDQLVTEVDVRPMQVSIDAMILSVHLTDEDKFGVNFQLLRANPNIKFGLGSPSASLSDLAPPAGFPLTGGLKLGYLDGNLGAFLEALEQIGDTNVISNPHLMVLNKQRAEIQIGQKQGYVNQTVTETSSTSSIEFLDTGTQLRVRPFISSDGLVRMEVHPELSDGTVELKGGFTLPNKNITQTTTNIMVHDGCTVVIGGLIHEQLANTTTQVPVLGNLPIIGFAFRQTDETIERREVIVLITPRIVYEPGTCQEGKRDACEFMRRQNTYADKMSPFGKRSIARRYYRLAETAYANGQSTKALWFAEMAVHFDPLNREALELRTDIWQGKPNESTEGAAQANATLANPLEGQAMPDWLISDLENGSPQPPPSLHPLDPGMPGRHRDLVRPKVLQ
jgi:type IV pilus assembly protein PilQ